MGHLAVLDTSFSADHRTSLTPDPRSKPVSGSPLDAGLDFDLRGAESYIAKAGAEESARLWQLLNDCGDHVARVRSLATKGQVLEFMGYTDCYNACQLLTWQYDRIQAFAVVVGRTSWNFENPTVQRTSVEVLRLDPDEIAAAVKKQIEECIRSPRSVVF